ncbi:protein FAR1-RELATED SEQUENCE 11-like [Wolffia australiana]
MSTYRIRFVLGSIDLTCYFVRESRRKEEYICDPEDYCTCYSFLYDIVNKGEELFSKHHLVARLAEAAGVHSEVAVSDEQLALLLPEKSKHGLFFNFQLNDDTLRLERVFWISPNGKEKYVQFNDVLQIDATFKTNRFGMPLVLFTVIDNHGLTVLSAGCLLSNEQFDSYLWALQQFRYYTNCDPIVLFTDGDMELARAIKVIWPNAIHLLCRFHISQNITRALAGSLRANLSEFMNEFWRVGSIEEIDVFEIEFLTLKTKWQATESYLRALEAKKKQWAFAYTHNNFVAGVSSTQRQEMVNGQIKSALLSTSSLLRIIDGFDAVETRSRDKLSQASLSTKFSLASMDPLINDALHTLTNYAQVLLKAESGMSLSYTCVADASKDEGYFLVSHKDFPQKFRVGRLSIGTIEQSTCSYRKAIWLGIKKVCETVDNQSVFIDTALATRPNFEAIGTESTFHLYNASMTFLGETIERHIQTSHRALSDLEEGFVRNPLTARCKGPPKAEKKGFSIRASTNKSACTLVTGLGACYNLPDDSASEMERSGVNKKRNKSLFLDHTRANMNPSGLSSTGNTASALVGYMDL